MFDTVAVRPICHHVSLSAMPVKREIGAWLGDSVMITCNVFYMSKPYRYSDVVMMHGDQFISDGCETNNSRFVMKTCQRAVLNTKHSYEIVVHNVSWTDSGVWSCQCDDVSAVYDVQFIFVPGTVRLSWSKVIVRETSSIQTAVSSSPSPQPVKFLSTLVPHSLPTPVKGNGTESDPIDLTRISPPSARAVSFMCESSCSYPNTPLTWHVRGKLQQRSELPPHSATWIPTDYSRAPCADNNETKAMSINRTHLLLNCSTINLKGPFQVICAGHGMQYLKSHLSSLQPSAYVICFEDVDSSNWFVKFWQELNILEIILLSIAIVFVVGTVGLCICLLKIICRRSRYRKYYPVDTENNHAIEEVDLQEFKTFAINATELESIGKLSSEEEVIVIEANWGSRRSSLVDTE